MYYISFLLVLYEYTHCIDIILVLYWCYIGITFVIHCYCTGIVFYYIHIILVLYLHYRGIIFV